MLVSGVLVVCLVPFVPLSTAFSQTLEMQDHCICSAWSPIPTITFANCCSSVSHQYSFLLELKQYAYVSLHLSIHLLNLRVFNWCKKRTRNLEEYQPRWILISD